jgi:hypothetical protein
MDVGQDQYVKLSLDLDENWMRNFQNFWKSYYMQDSYTWNFTVSGGDVLSMTTQLI